MGEDIVRRWGGDGGVGRDGRGVGVRGVMVVRVGRDVVERVSTHGVGKVFEGEWDGEGV